MHTASKSSRAAPPRRAVTRGRRRGTLLAWPTCPQFLATPAGCPPAGCRAAIRRYVGRIVERFHPEKVILFGSHAYGRPTPDSDVDLLVVMPAKDEVSQAMRIRRELRAP